MQLSHHALEQALDRGISESDIADAIDYGARWPCPFNSEVQYARRGNLFVVMHKRGHWVLTTYKVNH